MLNFSLRPLLLRRRRLAPNTVVTVFSVQCLPLVPTSHHGAVRISQAAWCSGKRGFQCSLSLAQEVSIITCWRGGRVVAGPAAKGVKSGQLWIQLAVGYGQGRSLAEDAAGVLGRHSAAALLKASRSEGVGCVQAEELPEKKDEVSLSDDDVTILTQYMTQYNFVRVLEVSRNADSVLAGARVLLLDKPGNVHSIYQKYYVLTEAYYDVLAALPAVVPDGPIGILGLGAGTAARLIHHFWPEIDMHGWELDVGVVQAARKFFDLEELEWQDDSFVLEKEVKESKESTGEVNPATGPSVTRRRNSSGSYGLWKDESDEVKLSLFHGIGARNTPGQRGRLRVHVGDALQHSQVRVEGGFAGIIVDLFAEGAVIPQLQQADTWRKMGANLMPGGRIMVNCGGSCVEAAVGGKDGAITMRETLNALGEAFPGELSTVSLRDHGDNSMALTGPPPDFQLWRDTLPECLRRGIEGWRPFSSS